MSRIAWLALGLLLLVGAQGATKDVDFTQPDETFSVTKVVEVSASSLYLREIVGGCHQPRAPF